MSLQRFISPDENSFEQDRDLVQVNRFDITTIERPDLVAVSLDKLRYMRHDVK